MIVSKQVLAHRLSKSISPSNESEFTLFGKECRAATRSFSILACSAVKKPNDNLVQVLSGRALLSDKKRPFEHLLPKPFVKSAIRVFAVQASMIFATYVTDQYEEENKREELVKDGSLTEKEADDLNDEWEKREWSQRWDGFPTKAWHGILKYQAIVMTMRLYEYLASRRFDTNALDKLTQDPFKAAIRASKETDNSATLRREMMHTCFSANIIAFLADFSVHQVILAYGYYVYYRSKRRQKIEGKSDQSDDRAEGVSDGADAVAFSFLMKSCRLAVSRALGLVLASVGGSVGSSVYPGWGTILGIQFGDGVVAAALDDVHAHSLPGQKF